MHIQTGPYQTFYKTHGDPSHPSMLLLHGIGAEHSMWDKQVGPFSEAGYYVITVDLIAHGKSSKVESLTLDDFVNQIDGLLNHLKIDSCILVGVSMGGAVALHYLVNRSDRVNKLIIADSFGDFNTVEEKLMVFAQKFAKVLHRVLGKHLFGKLMASSYKHPWASQYFYQAIQQVDMHQLELARDAMDDINVLKELENKVIPALIMVGGGYFGYFRRLNKVIAKHLPNAEYRELPDAKDPSNLANPEGFNKAALAYLAKTIVPEPKVVMKSNT